MKFCSLLITNSANLKFYANLESGQMHSYPFCKSKEKKANPDIRQLAELYESAGFDFRVVLLDRTPESSMASLLISRGMRHKKQLMWQAQEMTAGLQALNMQLSKLIPIHRKSRTKNWAHLCPLCSKPVSKRDSN